MSCLKYALQPEPPVCFAAINQPLVNALHLEARSLLSAAPFDQLVAVVNAEHLADHAIGETHPPFLNDIEEHHEWLFINEDEDDPAFVRLENLAALAAAVQRYADFLLAQIPAADVAEMVEHHTPVESEVAQ